MNLDCFFMKKDIISVFDEEISRKATAEEQVGIFLFIAFLAPMVIFPLLLLILVILICFGVTRK